MKKPSLFIFLLILCLSMAACVSPYQGQANALTQAYQRGEISANDYFARMNELKSLELQRQQLLGSPQGNPFYNLQQSIANRPVLQPYNMMQNYNPPRTTYGTIYTPSGQMYQYNSTTY